MAEPAVQGRIAVVAGATRWVGGGLAAASGEIGTTVYLPRCGVRAPSDRAPPEDHPGEGPLPRIPGRGAGCLQRPSRRNMEGPAIADRASASAGDPSFPIQWPAPGDELLRWQLCNPNQERPLRVDLERVSCGAFFRRYAAHGGPRELQRIEQFNSYSYLYGEYADPEAVKRWMQTPSYLAGAKNPLATWRNLLPPVTRLVERLEGADFDALSWQELQDHLEDGLKLWEQAELMLGAIDWADGVPYRFLELDRELFGAGHLPVALDLLRGTDCLFLGMVRDLVALQRLACDLPQVNRALREAAPQALRLLDQSVVGRMFERALTAFLERHGRRLEFNERDLSEPSWREDPAPVLALLGGDRREAKDEQGKAGDGAEASVRAQLESSSPQRRAEYWERLRAAREAIVVNEDYDVWMRQRCRVALRSVLLAFARRLTGTARIERAEDLWWLRLNDLLCAPYSITDWERLVAGRKAEWARWSEVTPPGQAGAVEAASASSEDPGPRRSPPADPSRRKPRQLSGIAASRGSVQGKARFVRSWDDVAGVQAGDIVVTGRMHHMSPSLALVLTRAAGFVTEARSPLERFAMLARELDIPAVVGCRDVERFVEDGQLIALDGSTGTVRLHEDDGPAPLEDWFDNIGTSDESTPWAADLDGYGWSLSAQALEGAGVTPGSSVMVDGIAFRWPQAGPGSWNNVVSAGQAVQLSARPGATRIGLLGLSSQGSCTGQGEIRYADGSTEPFTLSLPDWVVGERDGLPPGVQVALRLPRWNARNRGGAPVKTMVFAAIVPLRSDKTAVTVTLPKRAGQGEQHIFAVALGGAAQ